MHSFRAITPRRLYNIIPQNTLHKIPLLLITSGGVQFPSRSMASKKVAGFKSSVTAPVVMVISLQNRQPKMLITGWCMGHIGRNRTSHCLVVPFIRLIPPCTGDYSGVGAQTAIATGTVTLLFKPATWYLIRLGLPTFGNCTPPDQQTVPDDVLHQ